MVLANGPIQANRPKVVRRGCKRSSGTREQKSQKGLLHHQNLVLHRCNPAFHRCKRDLARLRPKAFCTLSQPLWGDFPESGDLPGPQLPNPKLPPYIAHKKAESRKLLVGACLATGDRIFATGPKKNPKAQKRHEQYQRIF